MKCNWWSSESERKKYGHSIENCLIQLDQMIEECNFVHKDAVRKFFDEYVINKIKEDTTEEDRKVSRMRALLRQYIGGTTTTTDNHDNAGLFNCFVDEIMGIYDRAENRIKESMIEQIIESWKSMIKKNLL